MLNRAVCLKNNSTGRSSGQSSLKRAAIFSDNKHVLTHNVHTGSAFVDFGAGSCIDPGLVPVQLHIR